MPKSESDLEGGDMDEYEKEIEEFKRQVTFICIIVGYRLQFHLKLFN